MSRYFVPYCLPNGPFPLGVYASQPSYNHLNVGPPVVGIIQFVPSYPHVSHTSYDSSRGVQYDVSYGPNGQKIIRKSLI